MPVGLTLFLGEWLFGSIGWGVLLGAELAIGGAIVLVFAALYVPGQRIAAQLLIALVAGVVVAVLLALDLPHRAFSSLAASLLPASIRVPGRWSSGLLVGVIARGADRDRRSAWSGGRAAAARSAPRSAWRWSACWSGRSWRSTSARPSRSPSAWPSRLALWPALVGIDTYRRGIDFEALKNRFYPRLTIETTKETIEWVRKQRPLGPKS